MPEYYNVTTNLGDAEIANAIATNTKLNITHIAFGDGNGSVPTPDKARTSLVREVHRQAVTKYERHATNANWIVIETIIPSSIGGFWVREMGIIANGKLISHGSHAPFEKVADPSGVSEYRLRFTQNVTDGSVVELTLDESLIYATQAWIDENYIKRSEIVDNLTTNEPAKPVSAKQAKVLQDTKLGKTENAASATKLQTARTIGGVSFDGSANINLPGVNTAGNQNTTGNAATATKLQTARTIGGVSFDGSANINLPGVNTAGNQSTTGNAATATSAAKWTTARTLTIGDSGKSVDGSDNVSWTRLDMGVPQTTTLTSVGVDNSESCIGYIANTLLGSPDGALYSHVYSEMWKHQIQGDYRTGQIALRGKNNGTWQAWRTVLDSGNYNNYSPTKTGTGASGSWGISITGNAATATKLQTARTLTIGDSGKSVDGSDNVSWTRLDMGVPQTTTLTSVGVDNSESCIGYIANTLLGSPDGALYSHVYSEMWKHQIQGDYRTGQIALRGKNNGTWQAWRTVLDSGNYNNYSPTKTGTGASGSWGISITGNAATATKLQTARTIGGVSFDGSANINLPGVNTAGNQSTSGNAASATKLATACSIGGVNFDGTANINLPGVNVAGNQSTSGNAASATKLQTARKINGVDFDGSTDIDLPLIGVNQTWQNLTASRAAETIYTNTTGKPIQVAISYNGNNAYFDIGGVEIYMPDYNSFGFAFFIIPNGTTYRIRNQISINSWSELR